MRTLCVFFLFSIEKISQRGCVALPLGKVIANCGKGRESNVRETSTPIRIEIPYAATCVWASPKLWRPKSKKLKNIFKIGLDYFPKIRILEFWGFNFQIPLLVEVPYFFSEEKPSPEGVTSDIQFPPYTPLNLEWEWWAQKWGNQIINLVFSMPKIVRAS
jgi:hypothetical protein